MNLQDVIDEIKINREVNLRIEKKLIAHDYEHRELERRLNGVEQSGKEIIKKTDDLEERIDKQDVKIKDIKFVSYKILAFMTAIVWVIITALKWLGGLALKALGLGIHP